MFNQKQEKELTERFEREKKVIDRELELYRQEELLAIDKEINERKQNNWNLLDEVRFATYKKIGEINTEVAKLEAKKEGLADLLKANEETNKQKDAEIKRLSETVQLLINKQPSTVIQQLK